MYNFLLALRLLRRMKKTANKAVQDMDLLAVATQAAGYGFEIGRGQPMYETLNASIDNPFTNPNWRDKVIHNG